MVYIILTIIHDIVDLVLRKFGTIIISSPLYLYLFDIGYNQTLCRIHGNTNVVVRLLCDSGTLGIDHCVENGIVVEGHRESLDDDWHVREANPLLQETVSGESTEVD
jgi:hypothetical protein